MKKLYPANLLKFFVALFVTVSVISIETAFAQTYISPPPGYTALIPVFTYNGNVYLTSTTTTAPITRAIFEIDNAGNLTQLPADPNIGLSMYSNNITVINGDIYFFTLQSGLWKISTSGNYVSNVYNVGGLSNVPIVSNNGFIFIPETGVTGGVWAYNINDGTTSQLNPSATTLSNPVEFVAYGSYVYFLSHNGSTTTYSVIQSDGTSAGTISISNFSSNFTVNSSYVPIVINGKIVFQANDNPSYYYSITPTGHGGISAIPIGQEVLNSFTYYKNKVYLNGQLYYDGTTNSFQAASSTDINGFSASPNSSCLVYNGLMYGTGSDATNGTEFWVSDGTTPGTHILKDIFPGTYTTSGITSPNSSVPVAGAIYNGFMYFEAADSSVNPGSGTNTLWQSDGTSTGTIQVSKVFNVNGFVVNSNNIAYVYGSDGVKTGLFAIAPKIVQTITFNALNAANLGEADFTPTAVSSSGLALTYTSSNPAVATIVSGKIHLVSTGSTTITAYQYGNSTYGEAPPVSTVLTVGPALSSDALLTAIKLTPASALAITTGPGYVNYTTTVANTSSSVAVTATTQDANATIKVNGVTAVSGTPSALVPLAVGTNIINVIVTAQDGKTIKAYIITATRAPSNDALLTSVKLTPASALVVTTGPGYVNYTTAVPNTTSSFTVTATEQDATATIKVNGASVTSGTASQPIALAIGANTINITVTAQDGKTIKAYIITATRAASSDALLTSIKLTPASALAISTGPGYVNYTTTVANTTASLTVTPAKQDANATIKVNGISVASGAASAPIALVVGTNTINITVTAQDGITTKAYIITATRAASSDALLTSIKLTPASSLVLTTGPGYVNYTTAVLNTTGSVTVTPAGQDATATIKVNGAIVSSGTASAPIALAVGANTINITVTAQDGKTVKAYIITAARAASSDALLTSIKLTPASALVVTTGPGFVNYITTVANTTTSLTVTPIEQDATATIKVNGSTVTSGLTSQPIALVVGSNVIDIVVAAQDGKTTKTYIITATRAPSNDALLTTIKLTPASALAVTTGPGYVNYTTSVPNTTSSVTVTATKQDANAIIKVNGVITASGAASASVPLAVGSNTITTIVTAQDGVTTKSYIITATRAVPTAANSIYDVSVTKPANSPIIENDGVVVHQAVSPNGDGVNDFLTIDGITNYPDNQLMILDRNGVQVYQTKGYGNANLFDGHSNINGKMQLPGTYFYSLDYTVNGQSKHKTGYIILKY